MKEINSKFNTAYFDESIVYHFKFDSLKKMVKLSIIPSYETHKGLILIHTFRFFDCQGYKYYPSLEGGIIKEIFDPNLYDYNTYPTVHLCKIKYLQTSLSEEFELLFHDNFGSRHFVCKNFVIKESKRKHL